MDSEEPRQLKLGDRKDDGPAKEKKEKKEKEPKGNKWILLLILVITVIVSLVFYATGGIEKKSTPINAVQQEDQFGGAKVYNF